MIGGSVDMYDMKAFDSLSTELDITSGNNQIWCKTRSYCSVTYRWSYTPIWYYLSSPIMYHGMDVSLRFNPMAATDYKRADQMFADIRLEGIRFLTTDYTEGWAARKNSIQSVIGVVRAKQRTLNAELDIWFRGAGYAMQNKEESIVCNWDKTDCYQARIYPHIDDISHTSGSSTGGQTLEIVGSSFVHAKTVEVTVDDVVCDVTQHSETSITCVTGEKATLNTPQVAYAGEHGLYRTLANNVSGVNADNIATKSTTRTLLTNAEIAVNYKTRNAFSLIQGFYEAPVDGLYQFHQACDDNCELWLSLDDPLDLTKDVMDPANKQRVLNRNSHSTYRNFYYPENHYANDTIPDNDEIGKTFTLWIPLVGGKKYYMESHLGQGSGEEHWTVGVEIKPTVLITADHAHMKPAKQSVTVHQDLLRDTSQLRVSAADQGTYRLMMLKKDLEYWKSPEIVSGCSAWDLRGKIKGFYSNQFGTDPDVSLECELNDGNMTLDCSNENVTTHIYDIQVPRSISVPSVLTVVPVQNTTSSNIDWIYSDSIQLSTPPLEG